MAVEVQEEYFFADERPQDHINSIAVEFREKYSHYPAKLILNSKYKHIGNQYSIRPPIKFVPSIQPLGGTDIPALSVETYYVVIEYNDEVDEKLLICKGFAKTL